MYNIQFIILSIINLFQRSTFFISIFVILSFISLLQRLTFYCNAMGFYLGCLIKL